VRLRELFKNVIPDVYRRLLFILITHCVGVVTTHSSRQNAQKNELSLPEYCLRQADVAHARARQARFAARARYPVPPRRVRPFS